MLKICETKKSNHDSLLEIAEELHQVPSFKVLQKVIREEQKGSLKT